MVNSYMNPYMKQYVNPLAAARMRRQRAQAAQMPVTRNSYQLAPGADADQQEPVVRAAYHAPVPVVAFAESNAARGEPISQKESRGRDAFKFFSLRRNVGSNNRHVEQSQ